MTIPPETVFEFIVAVADSRFYDYTSLTLRPQKIYELYNKADDSHLPLTRKMFRFFPI